MSEKNLGDKLFYKKKNAFEFYESNKSAEISEYAKGYVRFLNSSKTEREAVVSAIALAEAKGCKEYRLGDALKPGDRLYYNNRGKNLFVFSVGSESIENGIRICAAHVDSPRLDFKQVPLYEDNGFSYFKTHYYGGIKKYQWMTIPLAIHGVVSLKDGTNVNVVIGEDEDDPVFCVTDILPHLGHAQMEKPLGTAIPGEILNLLIGSEPYSDGDGEKEAIKLNMLRILNEKYGIVEEDLLSAELAAVPAVKARDLGLDRTLIAAYGHDDRVCAYPALTALLDSADSSHTLMCVLADKEETGSDGATGMQSSVLGDLICEISRALGGDENLVRANSVCLSADVSAGFDPNFSEVFEKKNSAMVNSGVVMMKYSGSRGKYSTNDASSEYIAYLRKVFDEENVLWQTAELGKVDEGGGGTVAKYVANMNINTVDIGVPVLSMHAPVEVIAKADLYATYTACKAFCK